LQGVLAQAKNGDRVFWEEKFHAANSKAQACTQGALLFFLLCWGKGGEFFFIFPCFPMCLHYVPLKFPTCSPISHCFPQHVLHTTSLLSHMPWKMVSSFHLYRWVEGEGTIYFKIEPSVLGSLHSFIFLSNGSIKLACCQKLNK
jgi:hypothetical protein